MTTEPRTPGHNYSSSDTVVRATQLEAWYEDSKFTDMMPASIVRALVAEVWRCREARDTALNQVGR